jgi:Nitrous oxide-stimulated promoter
MILKQRNLLPILVIVIISVFFLLKNLILDRKANAVGTNVEVIKSNEEDEKITIQMMIELYCRNNHRNTIYLCDDCSKLLSNATTLINNCPYSPKPACGACKNNCFSVEHKKRMKQVMKYSGPKMLFRHPILTIKHIWKLTIR